MKILADANILFVKEAFDGLGTVEVTDGRSITRDQLDGVDILLVRSVTKVNRELLEGSSVKFVASATIGTDHIDIEFLKENNIGFAHAPGSNATSVSEYVISAIAHLAAKKKVPLQSLTLGIIGVGNVGSRLMRYAQTLRMPYLLNDPPKRNLTGSDSYISLADVLKDSDVVSVHVPLEKSGSNPTYQLVNSHFLSLMKKDAILINTSRGDVVDERALQGNRNRLGGLVLDVWNNEPDPDDTMISLCDIATPHIAGYSSDGKIAGTAMIYENACAFFFKEKQWAAPYPTTQGQVITANNDKINDPVIAAIMAAYPILEDDARFRKIVGMEKAKRAAHFDGLRKNYPKRLEFCNFSISNSKAYPEQVLPILLELGFKIALT